MTFRPGWRWSSRSWGWRWRWRWRWRWLTFRPGWRWSSRRWEWRWFFHISRETPHLLIRLIETIKQHLLLLGGFRPPRPRTTEHLCLTGGTPPPKTPPDGQKKLAGGAKPITISAKSRIKAKILVHDPNLGFRRKSRIWAKISDFDENF